MATPLPPRPAPIREFETYIYKEIDGRPLYADVYPPTTSNESHPTAIYISGGGWSSNNRTDYPRPLFHQLRAQGYVICSLGYRSVPETLLPVILTDFKDFGVWVRTRLPEKLRDQGIKVDGSKLVVIGFSAGGHYALLTPRLWKDNPPKAILTFSTPTDIDNIPFLNRGGLSGPDCSDEMLTEATDFNNPPFELPLPQTEEENSNPRRFMRLQTFREDLHHELWFRGLPLHKDENGKNLRCWPQKGCVSQEEINEFNPTYLCKQYTYPPVYMIMGTKDELLDHETHMYKFRELLGKSCVAVAIEGKGHIYMLFANIGGDEHLNQINPAVDFLSNQL